MPCCLAEGSLCWPSRIFAWRFHTPLSISTEQHNTILQCCNCLFSSKKNMQWLAALVKRYVVNKTHEHSLSLNPEVLGANWGYNKKKVKLCGLYSLQQCGTWCKFAFEIITASLLTKTIMETDCVKKMYQKISRLHWYFREYLVILTFAWVSIPH